MAQDLEQRQALHTVLLQQEPGRAGFLLEEGREQLATLDSLPARAEGLDQGPLHHPHEAQSAVRLQRFLAGHRLEVLRQRRLEVHPQGAQLNPAAPQGLGGVDIVQQG